MAKPGRRTRLTLLLCLAACGSAVKDAQAPTVLLLDPRHGLPLSGTGTLEIEASDNVAVKQVEVSLDAVPQRTCQGDATLISCNFDFDSTLVADGTHVIAAKATDAAGNVGSDQLTLRVDNTPPQASITAPADGATVSGTVEIDGTFFDEDAFFPSIAVDGTALASCSSAPQPDAQATCTARWDTNAASPGPHTLTAKNIDEAGNQTTASITVSVE
jgi:hypothetical protein